MITILALDLAKMTGWAVIKNGAVAASGTEDFGAMRDKMDGHNGHMFVALQHLLRRRLLKFPHISLVVWERAHHRGGPATRIAVGLVSHVMSWAVRESIGIADVHSGTLKKFATGNHKAGKDDMVFAASKFAGRRIESDDEADAILVGMWAYKEEYDNG